MLQILKWAGLVVLILAALAALLLFWLSRRPSVPENYTKTVETGGEIEARYLAMGEHEVSRFESAALMSFKKYEIYYPSDIADFAGPLPVVVFVNGTGVGVSKYPALLEHMASWGFIAVGTEEEHAWNGFSAEMCLRYLEFLNGFDGDGNVFLGRVDLDRVGISGHSQGGYGVVNALTAWEHKDCYKAAVILSSSARSNEAIGWSADASLIEAPTLIIGSTGTADAALAPLESLQALYARIPDGVPKILARRSGADHGETLYCADGYVTAWFMYWLQNAPSAAPHAELQTNPLYQNAATNLPQ